MIFSLYIGYYCDEVNTYERWVTEWYIIIFITIRINNINNTWTWYEMMCVWIYWYRKICGVGIDMWLNSLLCSRVYVTFCDNFDLTYLHYLSPISLYIYLKNNNIDFVILNFCYSISQSHDVWLTLINFQLILFNYRYHLLTFTLFLLFIFIEVIK